MPEQHRRERKKHMHSSHAHIFISQMPNFMNLRGWELRDVDHQRCIARVWSRVCGNWKSTSFERKFNECSSNSQISWSWWKCSLQRTLRLQNLHFDCLRAYCVYQMENSFSWASSNTRLLHGHSDNVHRKSISRVAFLIKRVEGIDPDQYPPSKSWQ